MSRVLTPLRALLVTLVLAVAAGIALLLRSPRLTLANDAIDVGYPLHAVVVPALCALALAGIALLREARRTRILSALLALGLLLAAADSMRFRVGADASGLAVRRLFSQEHMTWDEVSRVESPHRVLILTSAAGRRLVVGTRALSPELHGVLERTIARRLRESARPASADETPRLP
jgi:hypothetical protein